MSARVFLYLSASIFFGALYAGCDTIEDVSPVGSGPDVAVTPCADQRKIERCHQDAVYEIAYCYDDNEIGPQPFLSGGDHPYFDCAAPDEHNIVGPGPFYFRNYWCCGTRGCLPGREVPCNCGATVQGFAYCAGDGLNISSCICPPEPWADGTPPT